jgi:4-carboxymuconolactone decarboxylase
MSVTEVKSARLREGERTRREVLSDEYVDGAEAAMTEFDAPFQALITETAWGNLWSRNEWTRRERSIVTISLLAALGHYDEMAMHIRATARTGATLADVREALLHVAIYAGVPTANTAFRVAKQVFADMAPGTANDHS